MEYILVVCQVLALMGIGYLISRLNRKQPKSGQRLFIDTSVLIDGRIIAVAESGFIGYTLAIPRSVIGELQLLADGRDSEKRVKARHGLDIIRSLQDVDAVTVEIFADNPHTPEGVDSRLIKLAREYDGVLCTLDYNLNKVAQVEGLVVANVNELAKNLRTEHLPGTTLSLALTTRGNEATQAVGHLEDGTMVVVEHAKSKIGSVVEVEVIRNLQTDAGRMLFARINNNKTQKDADGRPGRHKLSSYRKKLVTPDAPKAKRNDSKKDQPAKATKSSSSKHSQRADEKAPKPKKSSSSHKRHTSASREDDLISLVNSQK